MRGQSAIMDGLIFLLVSSMASGLLIYVSGLYAESSNAQLNSAYSQEFASSAMIALHYAKDSKGNSFWNGLASAGSSGMDSYLENAGKDVWDSLKAKAPSKNVFFCFDGVSPLCHPQMGDYPNQYSASGIMVISGYAETVRLVLAY